jgi:NAD(P)-dependent dehydrogenase (short-subunit alcohol dehydrogenase family)
MSQSGRSVLVTGASRGIGAAIARAFAAHGDRVAVHYSTSREAAEEVLATLEGTGHVLVHADLRDPDAIRAMVDAAADHLDGIDVLVNNAGIFVAHPIEEVDYETWQRAWTDTIAVNLVGASNVTWCALQHMPRHSGSRIVNVGSRGAFRGEPRNPSYGASKAGIAAFGQSIAKSLGAHGIAVTTIAPGFVETDMAAGRDPRSEPLRPRALGRGGGQRGAVPRLPRGGVGQRQRARLQRRQLLPPLTN